MAAIVADPSDDVARLIYADCLQEHGNAARAEFIRLQIEAERHHPHSNTRADLDQRAYALFAAHWIEWWGEVCTAVGLPRPAREPAGRFSRFALRAGLRGMTGAPYDFGSFALGCDVRTQLGSDPSSKLAGWFRTGFRRGFPDSPSIALSSGWLAHRALPRWSSVSPVKTLGARVPVRTFWNDGPYLTGVRSLSLYDCDQTVLDAVLRSPHLAALEDLSWWINDGEDDDEVVYQFVDHTAMVMRYARLARLKRLALQVWTDQAARAVASCAHLAGLVELEVSLAKDLSSGVGAARRLLTLSRSPHLAGLRSLTITGPFEANGIESTIRYATWTGLRKLVLVALRSESELNDLTPFSGPDNLPELEEFRLMGVHLTPDQINILVRSPLLKRVKHYAHRGTYTDDFGSIIRLSEVVDPIKIETFSIEGNDIDLPPHLAAILREKFGDRLHFPF
ncbi:TIGR02996 domain-containing protein [Gemmata sp. G18]|uniref:TIGR02996 domain-containing protein n=1 Tax=Gemmata palustris TaxID=2822762 RepID=A0ABS5BW84_9BACT|nr:TIGR02996 domain-containing protein [Gemmata palustris]MBP3957930.1 TIGR02996 domain-containing protein [Gemmata palustris]